MVGKDETKPKIRGNLSPRENIQKNVELTVYNSYRIIHRGATDVVSIDRPLDAFVLSGYVKVQHADHQYHVSRNGFDAFVNFVERLTGFGADKRRDVYHSFHLRLPSGGLDHTCKTHKHMHDDNCRLQVYLCGVLYICTCVVYFTGSCVKPRNLTTSILFLKLCIGYQ